MALGGVYWIWEENRARREWQAAEAALQRHDLPTASAHLDRYRSFRPRDPQGWFQSARTARRLERYKDAEAFLDRCQELRGVSEEILLERDLLLVQQGEIGEIDLRLRQTIGPDHPDGLLVLEALARGYLKQDRYADASEACALWRQRQPDHPWPWLWDGWIAERLAHPDQAESSYRRALALAPEDRTVRLSLGKLLLKKRQAAGAAEQFEFILARFPEDVEALVGLAECRLEEAAPEAAIPLLDRALARDPNHAIGSFLRGKVELERGRAADAEPWLRAAWAAVPSDPETLHLLIHCLRAQNKSLEADRLSVHLERLRADLRRLDQLLPTLSRETNAAPWYEAGMIGLRIGRIEQGVRCLHEALRRKGDHRPAHLALATYYRSVGDPTRANLHRQLAD